MSPKVMTNQPELVVIGDYKYAVCSIYNPQIQLVLGLDTQSKVVL